MVGRWIIAARVEGEWDGRFGKARDEAAISGGCSVGDAVVLEEGDEESGAPAGAEDEEVGAVGGGGGDGLGVAIWGGHVR